MALLMLSCSTKRCVLVQPPGERARYVCEDWDYDE